MATILIVDDSRTSRKMLRNILEADGYTIVGEAKDGEEGVSYYKELRPDITTMDITMPVLDGLNALRKIMEIDNKAKVIMVTAAGQKGKMLDAMKLGATDFLAKPFEPKQISEIMKKVLV